MKKVLFYGSIEEEDYEKVKAFLEKFIPKLLERDFQVITREGITGTDELTHKWLDNIILDIACKYRDLHCIPYEKVISLKLNSDNISSHDRKVITLRNSERFKAYKEILGHCDLIISIGGKGGVYRLGLVSAIMNQLFVPLSLAKGKSQVLSRELSDYLSDNYSNELVDFTLKNYITENEMEQFINVIIKACNQDAHKDSTITESQFLQYIENNPGRIKELSIKQFWRLLVKLPLSWLLSLFGIIFTIIVLLIIRLFLS